MRTGKLKAEKWFPWPLYSGTLGTEGDIIFTAQADGRIMALDKDTLDELWSFEAGTTIASVIAHGHAVDAREIEVSESAESEWLALIDSHPGTIFGDAECTPGYYNGEGREATRRDRRNSSGHPLGAVAYFEHIENWRSDGGFSGLEFRS